MVSLYCSVCLSGLHLVWRRPKLLAALSTIFSPRVASSLGLYDIFRLYDLNQRNNRELAALDEATPGAAHLNEAPRCSSRSSRHVFAMNDCIGRDPSAMALSWKIQNVCKGHHAGPSEL